jgi:predicted RNase H-like HicB family nuclease
MLNYKASYTVEDDCWVGVVLDFPGCVSGGSDLDEARKNLAAALIDLTESYLLDGEPVPVPDPSKHDPDSVIEEPIYLVLRAGHKLRVRVSA